MEIVEKKIKLNDVDIPRLLGHNDSYLRMIENRFNSVVSARGNTLVVKGSFEEIKMIETVVSELEYILSKNKELKPNDVATVIDLVNTNIEEKIRRETDSDDIVYGGAKEIVKARTPKQREYYEKFRNNDLVFAVGPAGTGKTFLAVAMGLAALKSSRVSKIILSRPAVEAGESLGFLPGDLKEKLDPYLRPLTDALFYMLSPDKFNRMMERGVIEITPLAYMRGRTLNNSFIILDEAQNSTIAQMKMFLTRLGANSKAIVTGDVTQIDLLDKRDSGLVNARKVLKGIKGIEFVQFENSDVVRHYLVAEIIKAYEKDAGERKKSEKSKENRKA